MGLLGATGLRAYVSIRKSSLTFAGKHGGGAQVEAHQGCASAGGGDQDGRQAAGAVQAAAGGCLQEGRVCAAAVMGAAGWGWCILCLVNASNLLLPERQQTAPVLCQHFRTAELIS